MISSTSTTPGQISGTTVPVLSKTEVFEEATNFVTLLYTELRKKPEEIDERLQIIKAEIDRTGTYVHTSEELTYGCKVAWRNSVSW